MTEPRDEFEQRLAQRYERYLEEGVGSTDAKQVMALVTAEPLRQAGRLRTAMLGTATIAAAALLTFVAIRVLPNLPGLVGTSSQSPLSSATASGSGQPTPSVEPSQPTSATWPTLAPAEATVPAALDLSHLGFWTLEQPLTGTTNTLRVGTLDGHVAETVALQNPGMGPLDVPLQPQPAGPAGGRVLYVSTDGHEAEVHAVRTTGTGADDRVLLTTNGIIASIAIDPSGETAYYLNLDPGTGRFAGVDSIAIGGGEPQIVIRDTDVAPVAEQGSYRPQLIVSMDGSWVALASCGPASCDLIAAQPASGLLKHWQSFRFDDTIIGIAGDLLIGASSCPTPICDGFVLDLTSGDRWPLGGTDQHFDPKQLIAGPRGALVLGNSETYALGAWRVEALDLTDRTRTTVFSASFKPAYTMVRLAERDAGAELPAGWFLIYRNADAAPNPYPDYSAGTLGGSVETPLSIMTFPRG
jgi:hypothetical protein